MAFASSQSDDHVALFSTHTRDHISCMNRIDFHGSNGICIF